MLRIRWIEKPFFSFWDKHYPDWAKKYTTINTATKAVAPSDVTALQDTSSITLNWSAVQGADGYKIFYKSGGKWKTTVNSTTATSHTFKNLKAGAKYTFAIQPYSVVDGKTIYGEYAEYTAATLPATVTAKATSPSKGTISHSIEIKTLGFFLITSSFLPVFAP